jgi:hypothetical protein
MSTQFPPQFRDLESIAAPWALPAFNDRYARRLSSSMEEMQTFYDTVFPRSKDILAYCDRFDIHDPPDDAKALMNVLYSLVAVSFAVEVWKQPRVPDSGAAMFESFIEPLV